ncbi:MAG: hypothetical protein ACI9MC_004099 [Kiritimatiellia bacterium]|jgi:hypothetical protein
MIDIDAVTARFSALQASLPPAFGVDDVRATGLDDALVAEAWRFLGAVYTDTPFLRLGFDEMGLPGLCAMILAADGDHSQDAFERFVLRTAHPALFTSLGPVLRTITDNNVHTLVIDALGRADAQQVRMIMRFVRAAYSGRYRLPLSSSQRDELDVAVNALQQRLGPDVQAALTSWILPAVG